MKKFVWKIWLRLNLLTKDIGNDYIAEVSTTGNTIKNSDIARRIVEEGSEIKYDTLLSILNRSDRIIIESIQQGSSVQTGYCHVSPRVLGNWIGAITHYDPEKYKLTCDMILTSEMREALKQVGIEVLGIKDSGAYIGLVTDVSTAKIDGTITPNDDIIIEGEKIKIYPEREESLGVFFINEYGEEFPVNHRLLQNDPKKVIARVPDLRSGLYTLKLVTKYTSSGKITLKQARTIQYNMTLKVP
jgi:hypothetical protein